MPDYFTSVAEGDFYGWPMGVTTLPDGSLLVADAAADKIWRVNAAK